MKYLLAGVLMLIVAFSVFAYKKNQADKERIKQAGIAHQQKLEREKQETEQPKKVVAQESKEIKPEPQPVQASTTEVSQDKGTNKYTEQEWLSICKSAAGAAKAIMNSRQRGVSLTEMMDKVVGTADPALKEVVKAFVIAAYEKPRFNTIEYQQKAELDFENEAHLTCLKARS